MMGHKIYLYGEICVIIPKLSLSPLLIWRTIHWQLQLVYTLATSAALQGKWVDKAVVERR